MQDVVICIDQLKKESNFNSYEARKIKHFVKESLMPKLLPDTGTPFSGTTLQKRQNHQPKGLHIKTIKPRV